jgi:hypothetical protein
MPVSRRTLATSALTLAGLLLAVAAVSTTHLPDQCWEIGRPNLLWFTRATIVATAAVWAIGLYTLVPTRGRARLILAAIALAELAAWAVMIDMFRQRMPTPCG